MAETANPCDVLCSLTDPKELNRLCECTLVDVMDVRESWVLVERAPRAWIQPCMRTCFLPMRCLWIGSPSH